MPDEFPNGLKLSKRDAMKVAAYFADQMKSRRWVTIVDEAKDSNSVYCTSVRWDFRIRTRVSDHPPKVREGEPEIKTVFSRKSALAWVREIEKTCTKRPSDMKKNKTRNKRIAESQPPVDKN